MLNGIIFEYETIIAMDLQNFLSKHYHVVNFHKVDLIPDCSGADFILIDSDPFTPDRLLEIVESLHLNPLTKIIVLTSGLPEEIIKYKYKHIISKPYGKDLILAAIES